MSCASFRDDLKAGGFSACSRWSSEAIPPDVILKSFHWQEGYAAFTVSASAKPAVQEYIARQEEHHRHKTFREELLEFLQKSGIEYDEHYLD